MMLSYETSQLIMIISLMVNVAFVISISNIARAYETQVKIIEAKDVRIGVLDETVSQLKRMVMMLKNTSQWKEESKKFEKEEEK